MKLKAAVACAAFAALLFCVAVPSGGSSALVSGAQLWAKRFNGPASGSDYGNAVTRSPDGTRVFVTGRATGTSIDFVTIAYNAATGTQSWAKRFITPGVDTGNAVAVSPDGSRVFVTGFSDGGSANGRDYATIAYNASTGAQLWAKKYNGPGNRDDTATSIGVSPDGSKVFVTGGSYGSSTTGVAYATVAYNALTGTELWTKRYNGPVNGFDYARALAVSGDGAKVFVTGQSYGGSATLDDYATVAYNASTGAPLWAKRYNGPGAGADTAYSIAASPDGTKAFVTGSSYGGAATGLDYATVAYNASTGTPLWAKRYNGPANNADKGFAVAVNGAGTRVFVTGESYCCAAKNNDYATVAYNATTGAQAWTNRYNGPGNGADGAYSIAVDPAGTKVFVTGDSWGGSTNYDGATVAYDTSSASQLWASRYNGPASGYDGFYSVAVSPDGATVFVTGETYWGSTPGYDVITAAYQG